MNKNKNKKIVVLVENGMLVAVRANFQDNIDVDVEEFEIGSGQDEATREKFKVPEDMSLEDFWAEQMDKEYPTVLM